MQTMLAFHVPTPVMKILVACDALTQSEAVPPRAILPGSTSILIIRGGSGGNEGSVAGRCADAGAGGTLRRVGVGVVVGRGDGVLCGFDRGGGNAIRLRARGWGGVRDGMGGETDVARASVAVVGNGRRRRAYSKLPQKMPTAIVTRQRLATPTK